MHSLSPRQPQMLCALPACRLPSPPFPAVGSSLLSTCSPLPSSRRKPWWGPGDWQVPDQLYTRAGGEESMAISSPQLSPNQPAIPCWTSSFAVVNIILLCKQFLIFISLSGPGRNSGWNFHLPDTHIDTHPICEQARLVGYGKNETIFLNLAFS